MKFFGIHNPNLMPSLEGSACTVDLSGVWSWELCVVYQTKSLLWLINALWMVSHQVCEGPWSACWNVVRPGLMWRKRGRRGCTTHPPQSFRYVTPPSILTCSNYCQFPLVVLHVFLAVKKYVVANCFLDSMDLHDLYNVILKFIQCL